MKLDYTKIKRIVDIVPKRTEPSPGFTPSAVLMLIFNDAIDSHVVYIRRALGMAVHSGNMAFPGGKVDRGDENSYRTAVRETEEEIGIIESNYRYVGWMGYFKTLTSRFDAAAHIAFLHEKRPYKIETLEVDEVIEFPLSVLNRQFRPDLDFRNRQEVMYLNFQYRSANLWGLTARITHHFLSGLRQTLSQV